MKTIIYSRQIPTGNRNEVVPLRTVVEYHGDTVIATIHDDPAILGKGKYAGWRALIGRLADADQVVVGSVDDLPGRTVHDLLKILSILSDHGVGLYLHREQIDTDGGAAAILALTAAYRAARRSEAIKRGISRARKAGKVIGRPAVPNHVRRQIQMALANGAGIRPTARRFRVSPGTVVNIRRMMDAEIDRLAA